MLFNCFIYIVHNLIYIFFFTFRLLLRAMSQFIRSKVSQMITLCIVMFSVEFSREVEWIIEVWRSGGIFPNLPPLGHCVGCFLSPHQTAWVFSRGLFH